MLARRTFLSAAGVGITASLLSACDGDSAETPDGAARLIARALEGGHPSTAPITGTNVDAGYRQITSSLGITPEVTVTHVVDSPRGETKVATLRYTWKFSADEAWVYDVEMPLSKEGKKWTALWAETLVHPELGRGERLRRSQRVGVRGEILGRGDEPLVTRRPVVTIGIDKSTAPKSRHEDSARKLAKLLGLDEKTYTAAVTGSGPKAFVEAVTLRSAELSDERRSTIDAIEGASTIDGQRDLAPTKSFAAAVLGAVRPATAEQITASKGKLKAGDDVGSGGLQQRFDDSLRGRRVTAIRAVGAGTDPVAQSRVLYRTPRSDGAAVRTTLDRQLQDKAEHLLSGHEDEPSALVAIKPSTGELLAVASGPGSKGYDTARQGRYAPGSTFKVVSSLALLRAGQEVNSTVQCAPTIQANGRSYHNFPDYPSGKLGDVTFKTALANSCNTVMIRGGRRR